MRAYQEMMYGVSKSDPEARKAWAGLLKQYCKLDTLSYDAMPREESIDERVRRVAMEAMPATFTGAEVIAACADVKPATVRRLLEQLGREGKLRREGRGRGSRWVR